jgi:hypothetical protein
MSDTVTHDENAVINAAIMGGQVQVVTPATATGGASKQRRGVRAPATATPAKAAKKGKAAPATTPKAAPLPLHPTNVRYVLKSGAERVFNRAMPGRTKAEAQAAALAFVKSARGRSIAKYL